MMEEEKYEWLEIMMPPRSGHMGCCAPETMHYLEVGDRWRVYIFERKPEQISHDDMAGFVGSIGGSSDWSIVFDGYTIASGQPATMKTAKATAMKILAALIDGPDPDIPDNPPGKFGPIIGGH